MSDGFPNRPSRDAFGPDREDKHLAPNDKNFVRDEFFNLLFWQVSGLGVVTDRAWAVVASDATLTAAHEAWDPHGISDPTSSTQGTGKFRLLYDATYPDRKGNMVSTALVGATITVEGNGLGKSVTYEITDGRQVDIEIRDHANNLVDAGFTIKLQ